MLVKNRNQSQEIDALINRNAHNFEDELSDESDLDELRSYDHHELLYQDAINRMQRQRMKEKILDKECTFHPQIKRKRDDRDEIEEDEEAYGIIGKRRARSVSAQKNLYNRLYENVAGN